MKGWNEKRRLFNRRKRFGTASGRRAPNTRVTNRLSYRTRGRPTKGREILTIHV